ncbi:amidohydrolase family protein [Niabella insulamsoli]|uniref:amidohydrolase family protein n=1 Tax=Niabella insulamsoli TaxID=3144874 RepID=UPI0031FC9E8D
MAFTKIQAAQLFDGYRLMSNKVLIVQQDGTIEAIVEADAAGDGVRQLKGILSPGFINCHCHLELSHLKGMIVENTGLAGFAGEVVQKRNKEPHLIAQAISDADANMQKNGIVAVGDICNTADTLLTKSESPILYHNFIEALGFNPDVATPNFERYKKTFETFTKIFPPKQVSITPHAPYSVSEVLWKKILEHDPSGVFSIHNQETIDETQWFFDKTGGFVGMFDRLGLKTDSFTASGKSSLQTFLPKFAPTQQLLLVHNVCTQPDDISFAQQLHPHLFWCLCPNANQYISQAMPPLPLFLEQQCTVVLGTDSLASNHQLSIWEEIRTLQKAFPQTSLAQMLGWATINGAKALKLDESLGSFEPGKKPGLVHIDNNQATRFLP